MGVERASATAQRSRGPALALPGWFGSLISLCVVEAMQAAAFVPYLFLLGGPWSSTFIARAVGAARWLVGVERWSGLAFEGAWSRWLYGLWGGSLWRLACLLYVAVHTLALVAFLPLVLRYARRWLWPVAGAWLLCTFGWAVLSVLLPVAPPRLLPGYAPDGFAGLSGAVSFYQYAAFPSFHVAFAELCALYAVRIWPGRGVRRAGAVYVAGMSLLVVITGNHYVIDVIGGWLLARASVCVVDMLQHRLRGARPMPAHVPVSVQEV